jgi:hypothetical protein
MHQVLSYTRAGGAAAIALGLVALAGCGGSGNSSPTSSSTETPSPSHGSVDGCLVGTWVATSVRGTLGGQTAQVNGGTGEKISFTADGSVLIDDSAVTVMSIAANGKTVELKQSGQGTGKVTSGGTGKITVTLDSNNTLSNQVLDATGAPLGTPEPAPASLAVDYKCTAGQELQLTQHQSSGDVTVVYQAGTGGSGGSGSSSGSSSESSSSSTSTQ